MSEAKWTQVALLAGGAVAGYLIGSALPASSLPSLLRRKAPATTAHADILALGHKNPEVTPSGVRNDIHPIDRSKTVEIKSPDLEDTSDLRASSPDLGAEVSPLRQRFHRICVFCGSRNGTDPLYLKESVELGRLLAVNKVGLVFGGGNVGLMGALAHSVHRNGGQVVGVIPKALEPRELSGGDRVGVQEVVPDMHTRKARMGVLSDAYIAMPGGYGTFEEVLEVLCWSQLGIHNKVVGILNTGHFFDPLLQQFEDAISKGFIDPKYKDCFVSAETAEELLEKMRSHNVPAGFTNWSNSFKSL